MRVSLRKRQNNKQHNYNMNAKQKHKHPTMHSNKYNTYNIKRKKILVRMITNNMHKHTESYLGCEDENEET